MAGGEQVRRWRCHLWSLVQSESILTWRKKYLTLHQLQALILIFDWTVSLLLWNSIYDLKRWQLLRIMRQTHGIFWSLYSEAGKIGSTRCLNKISEKLEDIKKKKPTQVFITVAVLLVYYYTCLWKKRQLSNKLISLTSCQ